MAESPFILQEQQYQRIKNILERLSVECVARVVFLVDRDGQPIAFHGEIGDQCSWRSNVMLWHDVG